MRLADWDAATTALYRKLWKRANAAHEEPAYAVPTFLGIGPLLGVKDYLASLTDKAVELPKLVEKVLLNGDKRTAKELLPHVSSNDAVKLQQLINGDEIEGLDVLKARKSRWRVRYALARLLTTSPPLLEPEVELLKGVFEHAQATEQKWEWVGGRSRALGVKPTELSPPPEEELRALWEKANTSALKVETKHGPIARLAPYLDPFRAEDPPSLSTLEELWAQFVEQMQKEPINPVPPSLIAYFDGEDNRAKAYRTFELPKRRGGTRTITTPDRSLKWLQRSLLQVLTHLFPRHKCAVGFERGESVVTHAKAHAGKRWVYVVDLKDFFPSITRSRVFGMLRAKPFQASEPVARYLANLVTHEGSLPQGAPTSPILANLLCRRMDARLFKWARQRGYSYTRYADDLAFSTNRAEFPEEDCAKLVEMIESEGFTVHPEKRRFMPWYGRQLVTGLVVNKKPNVPREYVRSLRAMLFNIEKFGWASQVGREALFDKGEEWVQYRQRSMSAAQFKEIVEKQRAERLLVRPGAVLPAVSTVDELRRLVRGRIEFVGAVKGKESAVYRGLMSRYRELEPAAKAAREATLRFEKARERGLREYVPEAAPEGSQDRKALNYRSFNEALGEIVKEEAGEERLTEWLQERASYSLECRWLLREALPFEERWEKARKIAFALDTHPHETAHFFREFNTYRSFRGLLHAPMEQSEGQMTYHDGTTLDIGEIVGYCEGAVRRRRLPNELREETERLLTMCREWLALHPNRHPWTDGDDATREAMLGYVYLTRFQPKLLKAVGIRSEYDYQKGRPLDFYARLDRFVEQLEEGKRGRVVMGQAGAKRRRGLRFYAYTPTIRQATELLIINILEKGYKAHVWLEAVRDDAHWSEIRIVVASDGGEVNLRPEFEEILGGDTQGVLYKLRGYARWTIEVPIAHDGTHRFDVMHGKVERLDSIEASLEGLRHIITVYQ